MSEHELKITRNDIMGDYLGECACGWICRRSRARDVRREHRRHYADAVKLTAEQWRKMQESTPENAPRDHTFTPIDGERE